MTRDPAAEYKRLLGAAHQASRAHAEHERKRAQELAELVRESAARIAEATKREKGVLREVAGWWSQETRHLAGLTWLDTGAPAPDPTADPRRLNAYLAEIEPATSAFRVAVRRAVWPRKLP